MAVPKKSERWLVVSAKGHDGYFQCENVGEVVRGVIPVWSKVKPGVARVSVGNGQETPHADVAGSQRQDYLTEQKLKKAVRVLESFGIKCRPVYSQLVDAKGTVVGTKHEVCFALEFSYERFDALVQAYLTEVCDVPKDAAYVYETDRD